MCLKAQNVLTCLPTTSRSTEFIVSQVAEFINGTSSNETALETSVRLGTAFQSKILLPLLAPAGVFFLLSVLSMLLLKRYFKGESPAAAKLTIRWRTITMSLGILSTGLALASAFGTSQSTGALVFASENGLSTMPQIAATPTMQVVQWFIVALSVGFQGGVYKIFYHCGGSVEAAGYSIWNTYATTSKGDLEFKKKKKKAKANSDATESPVAPPPAVPAPRRS
jgi:hypothetical protein